MKNSEKAFVLVCSCDGLVKEIICNKFFKNVDKITGMSFMKLADSGSFSKAVSFFEKINSNESVFNYEINIKMENEIQLLYFDGIKYNHEILVIAKNIQTEIYDLFDKTTKINNEQSNIIRNLIKKSKNKFTDLESANLANESFDNISRLNNELVNTQREVAIKNYELERLNKKLKELTIIDDMTGLFNRRFFYEKVDEEKIRASRLNYELILISIDINNFKFINDNYGHEEGDILLIKFAELLKKSFRKNFDSVFRFGGDEFVVLLVDCSVENSYKVLKKINSKFSKVRKEVSISYGVVKIEIKNDKNIDQYLKIADDLMFEYKKEFKKNHL